LDLYTIDLSQVVSKFIGETEKQLRQVFDAAQGTEAILFFDEADALFGKRSEVKDAHDRYANIEIGYLLQRMEEYDGIAIMATNQRKSIDDAFIRRLQFIIEFPFPEAPERARIWRTHLPPELPLEDDLDIDLLATSFKLSGGYIRNAVVGAAFQAAADGTALGMRHVVRAVRREFQKLGRTCTDAELGALAGALGDGT
jgi:SpoVK/Ycf46/Vps4 family AAA+-type ATPase